VKSLGIPPIDAPAAVAAMEKIFHRDPRPHRKGCRKSL